MATKTDGLKEFEGEFTAVRYTLRYMVDVLQPMSTRTANLVHESNTQDEYEY